MTHQNISASPPGFLDDYAKIMWQLIVPYLRKHAELQSIDQNLVELYCTQYGIYRTAYKSIKEDGITSKIYKTVQNQMGDKIGTDFVGFKRNPATSIYNDALKQLTGIGAQLGLSPKSRAELKGLGDNSDVDVKSEIKKMLG